MRSPLDTIAAIATPAGESGIGVVRVSGALALPIAQSIFTPAKPVDLAAAPTHTCYFGSLAGERRLDQAVVSIFRAPNSYTGEDVVEISVHGSAFILNELLQVCVKSGARLADPGEFTQRAFLSGKIDLTQAEAVADLIRAKTDQSHAAALAQLEGVLAKKVTSLRDRLLPLLAHVEVGLDHSDEDHDFLSRGRLIAQCREVQREIEELLDSSRVGKVLREGVRVALVGRPNVGKSSLLNALLKEDRAIVTPIPGTTRDTLEENINWDGMHVVLTDTAGLRDGSPDPIENIGIERSRRALRQADIALFVLDGSEPLSEEDHKLADGVGSKPAVWVINKADLTARWEPLAAPAIAAAIAPAAHKTEAAILERPAVTTAMPVVRVSAKTGQGLDDLVQAVKALALGGALRSGADLWSINARHQVALQRAQSAMFQAVAAAQKEAYEECVALELQTALLALGEIIGETATEDLLDQIFSKFCIGK